MTSLSSIITGDYVDFTVFDEIDKQFDDDVTYTDSASSSDKQEIIDNSSSSNLKSINDFSYVDLKNTQNY